MLVKDLALLKEERTDNKTGYKAEYPTEKVRVSLEFIHLLIHSPPALVASGPGQTPDHHSLLRGLWVWNMLPPHKVARSY